MTVLLYTLPNQIIISPTTSILFNALKWQRNLVRLISLVPEE